MQERHLIITKDSHGFFFVAVKRGADSIELTPPLLNLSEANQALKGIKAATGLPQGFIAR